MSTRRSLIVAAVFSGLNAGGKPSGLEVVHRTAAPAEGSGVLRLALSRIREDVEKIRPDQLRSPAVVRVVRVRIDAWIAASGGDEAEDALEPLLQWVTTAMTLDPTWGGLAAETNEKSTDWDTDLGETSIGHAWSEYDIRYLTKTTTQETL